MVFAFTSRPNSNHIHTDTSTTPGMPVVEVDTSASGNQEHGKKPNFPSPPTDSRSETCILPCLDDAITPAEPSDTSSRRPDSHGLALRAARSVEKVASSALVLGRPALPNRRPRRSASSQRRSVDLPQLSRHVTVGRNSQFHNLSEADLDILGGIEYRSLKLLFKIITGYFFGLHLFGVICLIPWIHNAAPKYKTWLAENDQGKTWWAIYSAQTMVDNLGFTLTPDSMLTFRDATWPMIIMTFLAFAGNTCYPVLLRLVIWITSKLVPAKSAMKEQLQFLLDHPRRCYTLLFPSKPTWILFGILFLMNLIDVLLIIVLDLDNEAVNDLPMGPRILSALFQAASARHTGTSTLNLALVNPAVQFSLLCMMYIAIFPIAIAIRASNTYEERALGVYGHENSLDETNGVTYIMMHVRNQFTFDLWYIFLGTFCICIAESKRIMDPNEPAFSVFPVFFEVVSAYGNVGLSLGHPAVMTSLCGQFTTFSKLIICAMMIRGRHRGLPNAIDRAIILPNDSIDRTERERDEGARKSLMNNENK
jgi:potassium uptake Trk family protein